MSKDEGGAASVKVEFSVDMTCQSCGASVEKVLKDLAGVKTFNIDVGAQTVVVESSLPSEMLREVIESTGKRAVLKGVGSSKGSKNLGSAVAEICSSTDIFGVVRFHQKDNETCVIDGTIDGLPPGDHGLHIHEYGDISDGPNGLGEHYNPSNSSHGGRLSDQRHYGDLGNVTASSNGRANFVFEDKIVKVWDIIGRSLAVTAGKDDLGLCDNPNSKVDGNSGESIAWAIIARSAGLFENPKRMCQCDGISIWEERDVPAAGESRSARTIS